mmetsp:Transcript_19424/g.30433  ORF Transcript_19424/g.30433 Transcript_19424/m.30433 type:complete len:580 (-) Transcript_19424:13-1752(-)
MESKVVTGPTADEVVSSVGANGDVIKSLRSIFPHLVQQRIGKSELGLIPLETIVVDGGKDTTPNGARGGGTGDLGDLSVLVDSNVTTTGSNIRVSSVVRVPVISAGELNTRVQVLLDSVVLPVRTSIVVGEPTSCVEESGVVVHSTIFFLRGRAFAVLVRANRGSITTDRFFIIRLDDGGGSHGGNVERGSGVNLINNSASSVRLNTVISGSSQNSESFGSTNHELLISTLDVGLRIGETESSAVGDITLVGFFPSITHGVNERSPRGVDNLVGILINPVSNDPERGGGVGSERQQHLDVQQSFSTSQRGVSGAIKISGVTKNLGNNLVGELVDVFPVLEVRFAIADGLGLVTINREGTLGGLIGGEDNVVGHVVDSLQSVGNVAGVSSFISRDNLGGNNIGGELSDTSDHGDDVLDGRRNGEFANKLGDGNRVGGLKVDKAAEVGLEQPLGRCDGSVDLDGILTILDPHGGLFFSLQPVKNKLSVSLQGGNNVKDLLMSKVLAIVLVFGVRDLPKDLLQPVHISVFQGDGERNTQIMVSKLRLGHLYVRVGSVGAAIQDLSVFRKGGGAQGYQQAGNE